MKSLKILLLSAAAMLAFASCSDEADEPVTDMPGYENGVYKMEYTLDELRASGITYMDIEDSEAVPLPTDKSVYLSKEGGKIEVNLDSPAAVRIIYCNGENKENPLKRECTHPRYWMYYDADFSIWSMRVLQSEPQHITIEVGNNSSSAELKYKVIISRMFSYTEGSIFQNNVRSFSQKMKLEITQEAGYPLN